MPPPWPDYTAMTIPVMARPKKRKRAAILTASLSKITASSFSNPARASEVDGKDLVT